MPIGFNGTTQIITLDAVDVLDIEDLYSRWKDFFKTGSNSRFQPAFADSFGGNVLRAGLNAGSYFTLRNDLGWRIRPDEADRTVLVTGSLVPTDDTLPMTIPTIGGFTVLLNGLQPITQVVESGISGLTAAESTQLFAVGTPPENADAVWDEAAVDHVAVGSMGIRMQLIEQLLRNRMETDPVTGVMTLYDDLGAVLMTANVFEDIEGAKSYSGGKIDRKNRFA